MLEATGDLWTYGHPDAIVISTNGQFRSGRAVMGSGCALEAKQRYPGIDLRFGALLQRWGNRPLKIWPPATPQEPWIVSYPVKDHWKDPAMLELIEQSARLLVEMTDKAGWSDVLCVRFGCGYGSLSWTTVRPVVAPILDDRFCAITFPAKPK